MLPIGSLRSFTGFVDGVNTGKSSEYVDSFDSRAQYIDLESPTPIQPGIGPIRSTKATSAAPAMDDASDDDSIEEDDQSNNTSLAANGGSIDAAS